MIIIMNFHGRYELGLSNYIETMKTAAFTGRYESLAILLIITMVLPRRNSAIVQSP